MRLPLETSSRRGFTLVELLVVIGVIAILIAVLLPVMAKARRSSNDVKCRSNLKQIALAARMYANDNRDHLPDGYTAGGANTRLLPGMRSEADAFAQPEIFGLPAIFKDGGYLKNLDVWICPSARSDIQAWGNTYAWFLLGGISQSDVKKMSPTNAAGWTSLIRGRERYNEVPFVYDNTVYLPWLSGSRRTSGTQGNIPFAERTPPHDFRTRQKILTRIGSINTLFVDGHVGIQVQRFKPGTETLELIVIRDP